MAREIQAQVALDIFTLEPCSEGHGNQGSDNTRMKYRNFAAKQPPQGAFTPFKTASRDKHYRASGEVTPKSSTHNRQGSRSHGSTPTSTPQQNQGQGLSGTKGGSASARSASVMSARKSLLSKLTSVAQQHARKILDRSARQREGRAERMARRLLKRKMEDEQEEEDDDDEEDGDEKDGSNKRSKQAKKKQVAERKESTRKGRDDKNKDHQGRGAVVKRVRDKTDKTKSTTPPRNSRPHREADRAGHKSGAQKGASRSDDKPESPKFEDQKGESNKNRDGSRQRKPVEKRKPLQSASKPRRPYKVRPLERVRTRGYSLLLASKQALRRAKRNKTKPGGEGEEEEEAEEKEGEPRAEGRDVKELLGGEGETLASGRPSSAGSSVRSGEKRRIFLDAEDCDVQMKKRSGSTASDTDSMPSRRSSRESFTAKPSSLKTWKKASTSSPSASSDEKGGIPTFHPTEAEFSDPMAYISKIQAESEPHGMCKIIPPSSWKLDSNKLNEDIRFMTQVQHVHRLYQRWGPNVKHSAAINQHLLSLLSEHSKITTTPQIGGVEVDLPQLYRLVEDVGGSKKLADKKHWAKIADLMNIPKQAKDRSVRLYDIYCRHVFPYASLSEEERGQLNSEVEAIHELQTVEDDAITKGRHMSLNWFSCIASNVQSMWFKKDPTPQQTETEYWRLLEERNRHVSVQCSHINTRAQASGFPTRKENSYSRHPWNLNNIPGSQGCVLKYLGLVPAVTIPTLHINMLFSTSCWSSAPHGLPYIQYHHSGAPTIWYCAPRSQQSKLRAAMEELVPTLVIDKPCWLREDWLMVNPKHLRQNGVQVEKCVQYPHQFVVVFPGSFTSTVSCGYNVSESVHFSLPSWLHQGLDALLVLNKSGERELFSMYSVLCPLVQDKMADPSALAEAVNLLTPLVQKELEVRNQLSVAGLRGEKRDVFSDSPISIASGSKRRSSVSDDKICDVCGRICYMSMVLNEQGEQVLCLEHGLKHVNKKKNIKSTRLFLRFTQSELETMLKEAKDRLTLLSTSVNNGSSSSSSGSSGAGPGGGGSSSSVTISNISSNSSGSSKTRLNSRQSSSSQ